MPQKIGVLARSGPQNRNHHGSDEHGRVHGAGQCRDPCRAKTTRDRHGATLAARLSEVRELLDEAGVSPSELEGVRTRIRIVRLMDQLYALQESLLGTDV